MSEENEDSARRYREAAEEYLDARKVEAAGVFQRPGSLFEGWAWWVNLWERAEGWLGDQRQGSLGRLRGSFLLAVTQDSVHAFSYKDWGVGFEIEEEIASFDRHGVRVRSYAGGEIFYFSTTEGGRR